MRLALALLLLAGCSSSPDVSDGGDAGDDAPAVDAPFAPAAHDPLPQVLRTNGGDLATAPVIVPVFFANDALQADIEGVLAALPGSAYWTELQNDYQIGPLTVGKSVVVSDTPPQNAASTDVEAFVQAKLDAQDPAWPAPTASTLYFVYYPATTTLTLANGTVGCQDFLGYHFFSATSPSETFLYGAQPRCPQVPALDTATENTTHELVEAVTDPFEGTYNRVDAPHAVWGVFPGAEIADMCGDEDLSYTLLVGSWHVSRFWSNQAASAGHDPCAPAIAAPFYDAVPVLPDQATGTFGAAKILTHAVVVKLNQSVTIDVQLFSDAPTGDWSLEAADSTSELTFAWDQTTGNNGDVRKLTITRVADGAIGGTEFVITSRKSKTDWHEYFAFAGN